MSSGTGIEEAFLSTFLAIIFGVIILLYLIAFFIFRLLRKKNGNGNVNSMAAVMALSVFCMPVCCGLLIYSCLDDKDPREKDAERGTVYAVQPTYYQPPMMQSPAAANGSPVYYPPAAATSNYPAAATPSYPAPASPSY